MLRLYFKQAIEQLKQDRLFSGLYIGGTGLAIATTTIMAVILFLKVAPLYPEYNRSQIYYVENLEFSSPGNTSSGTGLSYRAVSEWFYTLKNAEQVSAQDSKNLRKNGRMRAKCDKWLVHIPFLCYLTILLNLAEGAEYGGC